MTWKIKLHAAILAARIEYHWWCIMRHRKIGYLLLNRGAKLNSRIMLWLNKRLSSHAVFVMRAEDYFEKNFIPPIGGYQSEASKPCVK